MSQTPNTAIAVIGIDIGKNSFHLVGHDARGAIVLRQKWSRGQVEARLANIPPCQLQLETGYINARPLITRSTNLLATHGRTIHPGHQQTSRCSNEPSALPYERTSSARPATSKGCRFADVVRLLTMSDHRTSSGYA